MVLAPDTGDATGRRHLQGGRPQHEIETELCTIADVFVKINSIKTDPDCEAGCAGGTGICPNDWYPTGSDECSGACGAVFEPFVSSSCCICISGAYCSWRLFQYYTLLTHSSHPFALLHVNANVNVNVNVNVMCIEQWDQCGEMLTAAGMGGMDEMGLFCKAPHTVNLLLSVPSCCVLAVCAQRYIDRATSACMYDCRRPLPCSALPSRLVWLSLQRAHLRLLHGGSPRGLLVCALQTCTRLPHQS